MSRKLSQILNYEIDSFHKILVFFQHVTIFNKRLILSITHHIFNWNLFLHHIVNERRPLNGSFLIWKLYSSEKKYEKTKTNRLPSFTPDCAVAIAHSSHYYYTIYHGLRCSRTLAAFKTTYNHCKGVLENAKYNYEQAFQAKVERKQFESHEFRLNL